MGTCFSTVLEIMILQLGHTPPKESRSLVAPIHAISFSPCAGSVVMTYRVNVLVDSECREKIGKVKTYLHEEEFSWSNFMAA